ncbi:MAG: malonate decarboxylase holo-ACP synthase [Gammaproteobacteria bacterium]
MHAPTFLPHDLLFLRVPDRFDAGGPWPAWLDAAWLMAAPLVVRRDCAPAGMVAVGARGLTRKQRSRALAPIAGITRVLAPEQLVAQASALTLPCIEAFNTARSQLAPLALTWGPSGGVGFTLASGLPVLRPDSDLDLLVRAPAPLDAATLARLQELQALQQRSACRIDIQVDTGVGGFALAEYTARRGRVLLKTARGPRLVADPWQQAA